MINFKIIPKASIHTVFFLCMFALFFPCRLAADMYALIVMGKSGGEMAYRRQQELCDTLSKNLQTCGCSARHIAFADDQNISDRTGLLQKLQQYADRLTPQDKLSVFFFGHGQSGRNDFYISLPEGHIKAAELNTVLKKIKAPVMIFGFNTMSSELLSRFDGPDRLVVTATANSGQQNPPLLPEYFLARMAANPGSGLLELIRLAAVDTQKYGKENHLLISEIPALRVNGQSYEYPFQGLDDKSLPPWAGLGSPAVQEQTKQTAKIIKVPEKYAAYNACYLLRELEIVIGKTDTVTTGEKANIIINDSNGVEKYSIVPLGACGSIDVKVKYARVVNPDGTVNDAEVVNGCNGQMRFPGLKPGSRIEYEMLRTSILPDNTAAFSTELSLAAPIPQQSLRFRIGLPKEKDLKFKFYNLNQVPEIRSSVGKFNREYAFELNDIAALEIIPNLPPVPMFAPWLRVSAYRDWNEFVSWHRQMVKKSDEPGEIVTRKAKELTEGKKSTIDKIQALYDFVCAFRYDTTPVGVRAFRPRLPENICTSGIGDCKDKANLLLVMAKVIGIEGQMALLNRMAASDPDFPCWQFNHAIAFFPNIEGYPEGLWLDATESGTPFLTLPPGDLGRDALLLGSNGFRFKKVTAAKTIDNRQIFDIELLGKNNDAYTGKINITASGLDYYWFSNRLKHLSPLQKRYFVQSLLTPFMPGVGVLDIREDKVGDREIRLSGNIEYSGNAADITIPYELQESLTLPHRPLKMLLNDGQERQFTVMLKVNSASVPTMPPAWKQQCANAETSVEFSRTANGWNRTCVYTLKQPLVEVGEYPAFRRMILEWLDRMKPGRNQ